MNETILVFGLGDTRKMDDGIGVHVINNLKKNSNLKNVEIIDGMLLPDKSTNKYNDIERLIVIETASFDLDPGTVKVFEGIEMDAFVGKDKKTCMHKADLERLLGMTISNNHLPQHRALVCIQPDKLGKGNKPSTKAANAIPKACQKVFELSNNWVI